MKKITAILLIFAMCLSFVACNSDKKTSSGDGDSSGSKNKGLCSECMELLVGDWFYLGYVYTDDNVEQELRKVSITEDGNLVTDKGEFKIKFGKCGKSHDNQLSAYNDDEKVAYELTLNLHSESPNMEQYSINVLSFEDMVSYDYRSTNKYTVVEITEENWREYFNPNFKENFDIRYDFRVDKNEWGENTGASIQEVASIINLERYTWGSTLVIEYSHEEGKSKYTYNVEEETITSASFETSDSTLYTTTTSFEYHGGYSEDGEVYMELEINNAYLGQEEISDGMCEDWGMNPVEIIRMKGWLVIKNY